MAELIAYAKAHPGRLQYGSSGTGSPHHLSGELLRQKTGIDIVHVPYRGGGAASNDLLGGHIKRGVPEPVDGRAASRDWQDQDRGGGREDPLRGDAGHTNHRRDRRWI